MLKKLVLFCGVLAVCYAALAIGPHEKKPEKFRDVQGCYMEEFDDVIPFGQTRPSKNSCRQYRCNTDNISYESCGLIAASKGCKLVTDHTKPYPDCCPRLQCN